MPELKTRTTVVPLFQGDDIDPLNELARAAEVAAVTAGPTRYSESESVKTAAAAYDEYLIAATERAVKITLKAVGRRKWRDLIGQHPPRSKMESVTALDGTEKTSEVVHEQDETWGFNYETLADDLVPASIAPGQFDDEADRDTFLDALSDADWSRLYSAAVSLNQSEGPDPFVRLSSRLAQTSSETSASPARLG